MSEVFWPWEDGFGFDTQEKIKRVENTLAALVEELETKLGKDVFDFNNFYFAGGCIYSIWNAKETKDYDIFCKNKKAASKLLRYFKKHKTEANIITNNAITMGKFQFITRYIGTPEYEVGKFDFKHNMFFYDTSGLTNLVDWKYLNSNKLVFNLGRARDVLNILTRVPKFVERGMEISQSDMLDILEYGTSPKRYFAERKSIKRRISGKSKY